MVFIIVEIYTPSTTAGQAISTGVPTASTMTVIIGGVLAKLVPAAGCPSQRILLPVMTNTAVACTPNILHPARPEIVRFQEVGVSGQYISVHSGAVMICIAVPLYCVAYDYHNGQTPYVHLPCIDT
ncbi:hypothetical protein SUGI_1038020 [Cryptomeria japonica]|nr:hypothetical protein SUGI_1038020 [Cryptomeria japonica]